VEQAVFVPVVLGDSKFARFLGIKLGGRDTPAGTSGRQGQYTGKPKERNPQRQASGRRNYAPSEAARWRDHACQLSHTAQGRAGRADFHCSLSPSEYTRSSTDCKHERVSLRTFALERR